MLIVLRRRNYRLLWVAQLISMIGDWAIFAALPFFVYDLTGSVTATGVMFMIQVARRWSLDRSLECLSTAGTDAGR